MDEESCACKWRDVEMGVGWGTEKNKIGSQVWQNMDKCIVSNKNKKQMMVNGGGVGGANVATLDKPKMLGGGGYQRGKNGPSGTHR